MIAVPGVSTAGACPSDGHVATAAPLLCVEHLSMRFGGLVAINDLSFLAARGEITALIGPNGAGKTTVFNCITGFYKPTSGRIGLQAGDPSIWAEIDVLTERGTHSLTRAGGTLFLLERMPDYLVARKARVARTFQNIRLFAGMTVLENLLIAQHNALMRASGWSVLGLFGAPTYLHAERAAIDKARYWLDQVALTERADDRARHVHRSAVALSRRAGRRAQCPRKGRTRAPSRCDPRAARDLDPADRARHVAGDGRIGSHRGARSRRQDRRRNPGRGAQRSQGHRRLSRRRRG
jgi:branched-chain amino acid transport system ATP-binding protein